jgi:hypothetical protein
MVSSSLIKQAVNHFANHSIDEMRKFIDDNAIERWDDLRKPLAAAARAKKVSIKEITNILPSTSKLDKVRCLSRMRLDKQII